MALILFTMGLLFLSLFLLLLSNPKRQKTEHPKSLLELIKNSHRIVEWSSDITNASPTATAITFMGVITADPNTVEHITKTKFDTYLKGDHSTTILKDFLGGGIFNSDGDHWKLQRRTASIEFSTKVIRTFIMQSMVSHVTNRLLPLLSKYADDHTVFDIQEVLELLGFDNVCKVVFGEDLDMLGSDNKEAMEFYEAFERASTLTVARFSSLFPGSWKLKRMLGIGSEKETREKIEVVHRFTMKVVKRRKASELGDDLLSRFIAEGEGYSDEFLRDVIISFVLAGRDTSSATLTWFFWEVARRRAVKERLLEEIDRVRVGKNNGHFSLGEVREMEYMHAVLSETLRLHPPVPLQPRTCTEDDVLPGGMRVRKGTTVFYSSFAMGRSRRIWGEDWEEFKPERWLDGEGVFQPKNPYVYPVFHAGPRMCLGKDMAYVQMKVLAAAVMERFEVEVVDMEKAREHEITLVMKMKGGLMVRFTKRK